MVMLHKFNVNASNNHIRRGGGQISLRGNGRETDY